MGRSVDDPTWQAIIGAVFFAIDIFAAVVGALIASRRPRNPIGWMVGAAALLDSTVTVNRQLVTYFMLTASGALPAPILVLAWAVSPLSIATRALFGLIFLLFPSGNLPSRRWRPLLWFLLAGTAATALCAVVMPGPLPAFAAIDNPFGVRALDGPLRAVIPVLNLALVVTILVCAGSLIVRFRYAQSDERQQLKWIAYAASLWALALVGTFVVPPAWSTPFLLAYAACVVGFLVSLGVSILKYRLYSIDLLITRTLVYGTLGVLIGGFYVTVVAGVGAVVGSYGDSNLLVSLLATAVVALAFQPVRERVQRFANRLVFGHRATPYQVLAELSRRMAGAVSVDEVLPGLAEAVALGCGAAHSRVRVNVAPGQDRFAVWPAELFEGTFEYVVPVLHRGQIVGEIAVDKPAGEPLTPPENALLEDLAAQAGPALSNVRLTEDLRASRQRIVAAQDVERRRIERDLHDGAQQQLVALAVTARIARDLIASDPAEAGGLLAEIGEQATEALRQLRDLARGIYPPALADQGLAAALEAHLAKALPTVHLEVDPRTASLRFAPEAETAIYFCCLEALQNAAKHAAGYTPIVRLAAESQRLSFVVTDTGPGFDSAQTQVGSGLQGMTDRLAALGGSLEVWSVIREGTTVTGQIPLTVAAAERVVASRTQPAGQP
jgi:signal transduction histidine kinase